MRTDRRGFLRALANAIAFASSGVAAVPARAADADWDVHRETRNTRRGARGLRWPRFDGPPPPFKAYSGAPRVTLPPVTSEPGLPLAEAVRRGPIGADFAAAPVPLELLGRLLHFANGVTDATEVRRKSGRLRAAPSAGGLYAGEVYVVAARIRDLAPGSYYYDVVRHALVPLERGSLLPRVARALERPAAVEKAAAIVLLSNVFERYTYNYANRGYRYALIDTGHIGENLRLAAHSAGLREMSFAAFFDDALNELLGLDGRREAVCSVTALGPLAEGESPTRDVVQRLTQRQQLPAYVPAPARSAIERYHEATGLLPLRDERPSPAPRTGAPGKAAASPCGGTPLPALDAPPAMSVERAIGSRRSARRFETEPMRLEQLAFALQVAKGSATPKRAVGLDLFVAAHRVRDLAPGLYRYCAESHELELRKPGAMDERMVRVCLNQEKAGNAAVGLLMVAQLGPGGAVGRDRAYRDALIESGAIGQRLYLAAETTGLVARNLAAFTDDDLNRLLGLDAGSEAAVHLTMLGPGA
jgi:SagB-type dehydrogenase family enzyme